MKITVTKKHIKEGVRFQWSRCPIALAIKDLGVKIILVTSDEVQADYRMYNLSRRAMLFVKQFDSGKKVKPATFILKKE